MKNNSTIAGIVLCALSIICPLIDNLSAEPVDATTSVSVSVVGFFHLGFPAIASQETPIPVTATSGYPVVSAGFSSSARGNTCCFSSSGNSFSTISLNPVTTGSPSEKCIQVTATTL
ncbi:hypothetical protein [Prosthecochloris sp. HL-130-GSB]|uniref:hypothetical protein n=1 Tax=Prosthecochloris sp. HL-130-GSB TaxID=1974213 RepID=UPI000A1C117B|nr:hypothetical protein [Prosthecochloris sp. HL-130-GSB]ARM30838.1 hypothetical protein B9H02_05365 [Prosthecochloris sp. HL-130-GSB]